MQPEAPQTPTPSSSRTYHINHNYYILPSPTPSPTVHHRNNRFSQHDGTDANLDVLRGLFNNLQLDQRSQELIVGALHAERGTVNWPSLLTNSTPISAEHHPVLLDVIAMFEGPQDDDVSS